MALVYELVSRIMSIDKLDCKLHYTDIKKVKKKKIEALEPRLAHSNRSLSRVLYEAARSISTSPGRDASPSQVTPLQFLLGFPNKSPVSIYTPGRREPM